MTMTHPTATDEEIIGAIRDELRHPSAPRHHAPRNTIEAITGFTRGAWQLFVARLEEVYGKRVVRAALREEMGRYRESERELRRERERGQKPKGVVKVKVYL
jgi:hypothetical protein